MSAANSNPLTLADSLTEAGIERKQAEAIAKGIYESDRVATKADIEFSFAAVRSEIATIRWVVRIALGFIVTIAGTVLAAILDVPGFDLL